MAAQNAAIGVAVAAYYPTDFAVGAGRLHAVAAWPACCTSPTTSGRWAASASETLFDGGAAQRDRSTRRRRAYDAAVANYRGTVLTAFQDVEDDLAGLRILAQQAEVLDARRARRDARHRDRAVTNTRPGRWTYTTVATAQATQLSLQQTALNVQQTRLLDAASLIGDLGGGWSASELGDPRRTGQQQVSP